MWRKQRFFPDSRSHLQTYPSRPTPTRTVAWMKTIGPSVLARPEVCR